MFVFLLVVGIVMAVFGFLGFAFADESNIVYAYVMGGGLFFTAITSVPVMKNCFFELAAPVKEYLANIGVLQKQYDELVVKLEGFVEKYFSHETGLLEALKGRDSGNLSALLENYPELKAMGGTKTLIEKIVELRGEICNAQKKHNEKVASFNQYAQMTPYRYLVPSSLEKEFQYINPDAK